MSILDDRRDQLTSALSMCQCFTDDLHKLSAWVQQTKDMLNTQQGHVGSATEPGEMDSIAIDPKVDYH